MSIHLPEENNGSQSNTNPHRRPPRSWLHDDSDSSRTRRARVFLSGRVSARSRTAGGSARGEAFIPIARRTAADCRPDGRELFRHAGTEDQTVQVVLGTPILGVDLSTNGLRVRTYGVVPFDSNKLMRARMQIQVCVAGASFESSDHVVILFAVLSLFPPLVVLNCRLRIRHALYHRICQCMQVSHNRDDRKALLDAQLEHLRADCDAKQRNLVLLRHLRGFADGCDELGLVSDHPHGKAHVQAEVARCQTRIVSAAALTKALGPELRTSNHERVNLRHFDDFFEVFDPDTRFDLRDNGDGSVLVWNERWPIGLFTNAPMIALTSSGVSTCGMMIPPAPANTDNRDHLPAAFLDDNLDALDQLRRAPSNMLRVLRQRHEPLQEQEREQTHDPTPICAGYRDCLGDMPTGITQCSADGNLSRPEELLGVGWLLQRRPAVFCLSRRVEGEARVGVVDAVAVRLGHSHCLDGWKEAGCRQPTFGDALYTHLLVAAAGNLKRLRL
uniref:Uncharacterized protein n=1 Tax=Mycena chlorophos TaxID=658473 RepID=A0ABQ0KWR5_MYCCL|nr:predicted protein [Mycena chlorophos]